MLLLVQNSASTLDRDTGEFVWRLMGFYLLAIVVYIFILVDSSNLTFVGLRAEVAIVSRVHRVLCRTD